jgi:tetratricopeptide (TPR) repeat protein
VDALFQGSLSEDASKMRLDARLIRVADERVLWQRTWVRSSSDVLALRAAVVREIASHLGSGVTDAEQKRLHDGTRYLDPQKYALLLKGRLLAGDNPSPANVRRGIAMLESFVTDHPQNSDAWTGIAEGWLALANAYLSPHETMPRARHAAERALAISPDEAGAYAALGRIQMFYDWNWDGARASFTRAMELNPNSSAAHEGMAWLETATGHQEEALASVRRALRLNPLSLWAHAQATLILADGRRYDEAVQSALRTLELEPRFGLVRSVMGVAHCQRGEHARAVRELEKAVEDQPIPTTLGFLAYGYGVAGRT